MFTFNQIIDLEDFKSKYIDYLKTLSFETTEFNEEQIYNSDVFEINQNKTYVGFYVYSNKENTLFKFYVIDDYRTQESEIIDLIIKKHGIKKIEVATFDSILLNLAIERQKRVSVLGIYFKDHKKVIPHLDNFPKATFRAAEITDMDRIVKISNNFFDELEHRIERNELFLLENNNEILGIGICVWSYYDNNVASIGIFTNEKYRQKGIGKYIISKLKENEKKKDMIVNCGCEIDNKNSKKTLEGAGFIPYARQLLIEV